MNDNIFFSEPIKAFSRGKELPGYMNLQKILIKHFESRWRHSSFFSKTPHIVGREPYPRYIKALPRPRFTLERMLPETMLCVPPLFTTVRIPITPCVSQNVTMASCGLIQPRWAETNTKK